MANRTPFDLNDSINHWKKAISRDAHFTKENITELESHLLDEIHNLNGLGLTDEESFMVAKRRIGEVKFLATEYGKVNKKLYFLNRILPYLKGILLYLAFIKLLNFLSTGVAIVSQEFGINIMHLNAISIGSLFLGSLGVFLYILDGYKQGKFRASNLIEIPVLVGVILISEVLIIFSRNSLISSIGIEYFGRLQMNLSVYGLIVLVSIVALSCFVFLTNKKEKKTTLAN